MRIQRSLAVETKAREGGFTLVELLVVVSIIVALAAVSVVSVGKFAGKGQEGATASEQEAVQAAMDAMLAAKGIAAVTANDLTTVSSSIQTFTALPAEAGAGGLAGYMRQDPTTYTYCWDATGKVKQFGTTSVACTVGPY
ncbi:MAG: type II secretion system protein [Dehalococcoidia bacterium]|nr:type II secretion system protein [Dehalococcoidia bacterium]